jgi:hypothetical protein
MNWKAVEIFTFFPVASFTSNGVQETFSMVPSSSVPMRAFALSSGKAQGTLTLFDVMYGFPDDR